MNRTAIGVSIALLLVGSLALSVWSCGGTAASGDTGKKVILLGFDGMDYDLASEMMAEGLMPNFSSSPPGAR